MMRGIPRKAVELDLPVLGGNTTAARIADRENVCPWNPDSYGIDHSAPGAQAFYDSQLALFAEWGVDVVKLDDVLYPPTQSVEIAACSRAIERCGRPIVLSLSPGRALSLAHRDELALHSEMWRISDDLHLSDVGSERRGRVQDLWAGDDVALREGSVRLSVPAHGTRLLRLSRPSVRRRPRSGPRRGAWAICSRVECWRCTETPAPTGMASRREHGQRQGPH